jgi:hypothetical protein
VIFGGPRQRQLRLPFSFAPRGLRHDRTVNSPKPALVTQAGARRLPRVPLLLLCAAYLLPGLIGRDPWRNADLAAFGLMVAMAEGRTSWWSPALGGVTWTRRCCRTGWARPSSR